MCESEPEAETTLLATGDGRPREAAGMRAGPTALLGYRASSLPYHYQILTCTAPPGRAPGRCVSIAARIEPPMIALM